MWTELGLVLYLTFGAADVLGTGGRALKRVYKKQQSLKECREICDRQVTPPCIDVDLHAGVCTLLATKGVNSLHQSDCLICSLVSEFECPGGFLYIYPEGPLKASMDILPSCYHFGTSKANWFDAREICKGHRGDLAVIETESENEHLYGLLRLSPDPQTTRYWIAGVDDQTEGDWQWVTSGDRFSYTNWNPGQPDDALSAEDCLELRRDFDWAWNDQFCLTVQGFICEARAKKIEQKYENL